MTTTEFDQTIQANKSSKNFLFELYRHRELFLFLAWRDIIVRYKQTTIGIIWVIIRPLLNMALFTLIFGKIAHLSSSNVPYSDTSNSLTNNIHLINKVYFPRIILATSQILVHLVDFSVNFILLIILMGFMGFQDLSMIWTLPLFLILAQILCVGSSLWLSALNVQYRDFKFIVIYLIQLGMFASPVGYGSYVIQGFWKWIYFLNPMVGIIDGFRLALFGTTYPDMIWSILFSFLISSYLIISGFCFFQKTERSFADRI